MTWEPRPTPNINPETEKYWQEAKDGKLLLKECDKCDLVFHYPRSLCPDCFEETNWIQSSGHGNIYSYSVSRSISGWPEDHSPLVVAYVELNEGPRILSNIINCDPEEIDIGKDVSVHFIDSQQKEIAIPVFEPL